MSLSGQQCKQLQEALIEAFPNRKSLEQMLLFGLNKNLGVITSEGNLQEIVFELIKTANANGWVKELVQAACNSNPKNPQLKTIANVLLPNEKDNESKQGHLKKEGSIQQWIAFDLCEILSRFDLILRTICKVFNNNHKEAVLFFSIFILIIVILIRLNPCYIKQEVNEALAVLKSGRGTVKNVEFLVKESKEVIRTLMPQQLANYCFGNCSLAELELEKIKLTEGKLQGANFYRTVLREADISIADLQGVNFWASDLYKANLQGADLRRSNLLQANLREAKFFQANLRGANFLRADFWKAKGLTHEQIKSGCNWKSANYKDNFDKNRAFINFLENEKSSNPEGNIDCSKWEIK